MVLNSYESNHEDYHVGIIQTLLIMVVMKYQAPKRNENTIYKKPKQQD